MRLAGDFSSGLFYVSGDFNSLKEEKQWFSFLLNVNITWDRRCWKTLMPRPQPRLTSQTRMLEVGVFNLRPLIFCYWLINYLLNCQFNLSAWISIELLPHRLCRSGVQAHSSGILCSGSHPAEINFSSLCGSWCSFKLTGCWHKSFPCGYRTEVPVVFLAVGQRTLCFRRPC